MSTFINSLPHKSQSCSPQCCSEQHLRSFDSPSNWLTFKECHLKHRKLSFGGAWSVPNWNHKHMLPSLKPSANTAVRWGLHWKEKGANLWECTAEMSKDQMSESCLVFDFIWPNLAARTTSSSSANRLEKKTKKTMLSCLRTDLELASSLVRSFDIEHNQKVVLCRGPKVHWLSQIFCCTRCTP